ncbi:MAG TPA: hypothetical protein VG737_00090 [Cyclobacteriaceae bacterium]|nr:hypothetical protein [Cyclobacteriaceae bacterium]
MNKSIIFELCAVVASVILSCCSGKVNEKTATNIDSVATESADSVALDYSLLESYVHEAVADTTNVETVDYDCAVLVYPTEDQIAAMEKEYGDDFYTVADDAQFYQATAIEKLDSAGITQLVSNSKRYLKFQGNSREWTLDVRKRGAPEWNVIFFKKEKQPKIAYAIDVNSDSIRSYFNK